MRKHATTTKEQYRDGSVRESQDHFIWLDKAKIRQVKTLIYYIINNKNTAGLVFQNKSFVKFTIWRKQIPLKPYANSHRGKNTSGIPITLLRPQENPLWQQSV